MSDRGQVHLISAASHQSVTTHEPSDDRTVLFDGRGPVSRTGGCHGAAIAIHRRDMVLVESDEKVMIRSRSRSWVLGKAKRPGDQEKSQDQIPAKVFIPG